MKTIKTTAMHAPMIPHNVAERPVSGSSVDAGSVVSSVVVSVGVVAGGLAVGKN